MGIGMFGGKVSGSTWDKKSASSAPDDTPSIGGFGRVSASRQGSAPDTPSAPVPAPRKTPGNPDPKNFKIVRMETVGNFVLILINYPDCLNYEGNKIIAVRASERAKLEDQLRGAGIDPHFCDNQKYVSPVARFMPTNEGWDMAVAFATAFTERQQ
jgi:hypothetical protein